MKKTKVAIVLHGLGANGIDSLFANLSYFWDYDKFDITYFLAVDENADQFWEQIVISNGVRVIHLHDLDKKRLVKWPHTLKKALKEHGPFDAVHMNMDMLNGINLKVAYELNIPVRICHAHRSTGNCDDNEFKNVYKNIMRDLIQKYSTDYIACSDLAGKYFYLNEPFKIIYNGIDIERYKRENYYKQNPEKIIFITVGRFTALKNPFFIVEIFSEILKLKPCSILKWVGNGELFDEVKQKVKELNIESNVEFLGLRNDVNEILKGSDYFILPSISEGLSIALAEAQATGLECFVSDTVSVMSDCGGCIYISLNDSASTWAHVICKYIDSGKTKIIDKKKLSKFDIKNMALELENIYLK